MRENSKDSDDVESSDQTGRTDTSPATVRHDWRESDQPSMVVVEAVAAATDRPATDLPPLQGTLDADALDTLLNGQSSVTISFRYADTAVSVDGGGRIEVHVDGTHRAERDE